MHWVKRWKYSRHLPSKHFHLTCPWHAQKCDPHKKFFTVCRPCCCNPTTSCALHGLVTHYSHLSRSSGRQMCSLNGLVPSHSVAVLQHRSPWTWHLVQGYITQSEVMVWLSLPNYLITVEQTLLSDQIIYLAWHTGMISLIGEIPSICFILAWMDSDGGPKTTPPRTSLFLGYKWWVI